MKLLSSLTFTSRLKCQTLALFSSCVSLILSTTQLFTALLVSQLMTFSIPTSSFSSGRLFILLATMIQILTQSLNSDQPLPLGAALPRLSVTHMRSMSSPAKPHRRSRYQSRSALVHVFALSSEFNSAFWLPHSSLR